MRKLQHSPLMHFTAKRANVRAPVCYLGQPKTCIRVCYNQKQTHMYVCMLLGIT